MTHFYDINEIKDDQEDNEPWDIPWLAANNDDFYELDDAELIRLEIDESEREQVERFLNEFDIPTENK